MTIDKPTCNIDSNTYVENSLDIYLDPSKIKVKQWSYIASMNINRMYSASFVIGGYAYVVGGCGSYNVTLTSCERYDPTTNTWTMVASRLEGLLFSVGFSIGSYGYVCGGYLDDVYDYTGSSEKYNPATNTWSYITTMRGSYAPSAFVLNGYAYVVGGGNYNSALYDVQKYDPTTDTWVYVASTSTHRRAATAFAINGYGYVCGGGYSSATRTVEKYDPTTNTWSYVKRMNGSKWWYSSFVLNNEGYVVGGATNSISLEKYNPTTNEWTAMSTTTEGRYHSSSFAIGEYGYTCGGYIYDGTNNNLANKTTECYGKTSIEITTDTYYTLDGTTPVSTSAKFANTFKIYKDTILKARAIYGYDISEVLTVDIKFDKLITQSEVLTNTLLFTPELIYKDPYYDKFKQIDHTLKLEGDDTE